MGFIDTIKARAKADKKTIVLPESEDRRTYEAAAQILKEDLANLIIIGSEEAVKKGSEGLDVSKATIVDPEKNEKTQAYVDKLVELRAKKGMTPEKARETILNDYTYYGVMMVKMGDAEVGRKRNGKAGSIRRRTRRESKDGKIKFGRKTEPD